MRRIAQTGRPLKTLARRSILAGAAALCTLIAQGGTPPVVMAQEQRVIDRTLVIHIDNGYAGARLTHFLDTGTEHLPLRFAGNPPRLHTGSRVRARGLMRDGTLM